MKPLPSETERALTRHFEERDMGTYYDPNCQCDACRLVRAGHASLEAKCDRIGDAKKRKATPLFSGCINYFPDALLAVAELSRVGNDQHNPGKPLHWDRSKSGDEADALARHLVDAGKLDTDGVRHSAKVAWRALALLQKEIEAAREL